MMDSNGVAQPFSVQQQEQIVANIIEPMAGDGLRTICLAYKDFMAGWSAIQNPYRSALTFLVCIPHLVNDCINICSLARNNII